MSDNSDQLRFGENGELKETEEESQSTDNLRDDGDPMGRFQSKAGYSIFDLASYLQKCVRRSDQEGAAFAAFELCRSGYSKMYWKRIVTISIEDIATEDSVTSEILDLYRLATGQVDPVDNWHSDESRGRIVAMRAAIRCAEAMSSRLPEYMNDTWKRVADERVRAAKDGREPLYDFPAGDLKSDGKHDVIFDMHTSSGSGKDRGYGHFLVHSSRTDHISNQEKKFKRQNMELVDKMDDTGASFSETEYKHALSATDSDNPWNEPDFCQETLDSK